MKLKKDLVIFEKGNKNDTSMRKSVKIIRDRYKKAGFGDARVTFEGSTKTIDGQAVRQVVVSIDEGIQTVVEAVNVNGNQSLQEDVVSGQMLTRPPGFIADGGYAPDTLAEDIQAIKSLYLQKGFLSPEIQEDVTLTSDRRLAEVDINIDEGPQSLVTHVTFKGVTAITEAQALNTLSLKPGEPFREYMLTSDENALAAVISEKGYPHVTVRAVAEVNETTRQVRIDYRVEEGPPVRMGQVYTSGNFRTRNNIIIRKVKLKPHAPLSLRGLLESQKNIRNMGSLSSVKFRYVGLKEKADTVDLIIEVKEKKPYYVESGLGYDTERGFFADARLGDLNFRGANQNIWLAGDVSDIGYEGEFGLREPELFGTRITSQFSLYAERRKEFNKDFGIERYGTALSFSRKWADRLRFGLGFRLESREQYDRDPEDVLQPEELEPRTLFAVTPSIHYDRRDSFVRPRKGFAATFAVDFSSALAGGLDDFINYRFNGQYYVTPFDRLTLAFIGRLGYLDPYGNDLVPEDQLYFLGGTSSVRGYKENLLRFNQDDEAVGGREAISGTVEARIDMGGNLELALFFDTGRVGEPILDVGPSGFRSAVGGGIRYRTPVGPIGLLYGYKLDRQPEESPGRVHFSIGYSF